jgi:hypothetical protein
MAHPVICFLQTSPQNKKTDGPTWSLRSSRLSLPNQRDSVGAVPLLAKVAQPVTWNVAAFNAVQLLHQKKRSHLLSFCNKCLAIRFISHFPEWSALIDALIQALMHTFIEPAVVAQWWTVLAFLLGAPPLAESPSKPCRPILNLAEVTSWPSELPSSRYNPAPSVLLLQCTLPQGAPPP